MILSNFHTHTTYCDGKFSAEEMVLSAIENGMHALGFSTHSYTSRDLTYCIRKEKIKEYQAEIYALKEKYKDKIRIYCGSELDVISDMDREGFDYFLGAVHYIDIDGKLLTVDGSGDEQKRDADKYFGGDMLSYAEAYYEMTKKIADLPEVGFIAHFDLVTKFNENYELFDEKDPRYVKAWQDAALHLIKMGIPFEINTGAISRKKRTTPYPRREIADFIKEHGGTFIMTSDCHDKDFLLCHFEESDKIYEGIEVLDFEDLLRK